MGMPPTWKPFTGGYCAVDRSDDENRPGGGAFVGIYKDLVPSLAGFGASAEGYAGGYSGVAGLNGGVRALAELRGIFLKVGIDYDFQRQDTSTIISFTLPIRRGGIFGYGTHLRVDWLPDRGNSWAVGVQSRSSRTWARRGRATPTSPCRGRRSRPPGQRWTPGWRRRCARCARRRALWASGHGPSDNGRGVGSARLMLLLVQGAHGTPLQIFSSSTP